MSIKDNLSKEFTIKSGGIDDKVNVDDDMDDMASAITSALEESGGMEEFKGMVLKYFEFAQDISKLEIALRERKKKMKFYQDKILNFMKAYQIEDLDTKMGKITAYTRDKKSGLSEKIIKDKLKTFFPDKPDTVAQLMNLFNQRTVKQETKIKYEIKTIAP
jgi:hypothetical protein